MNLPLIPRYSFGKYTDISPSFLVNLNIKFLMLDLDNTIAKYSEHSPSPAADEWVRSMRGSNIQLFIISNSKREYRVEAFADALCLPYIKNAQKPSPVNLLSAMQDNGFIAIETAFLGDQIFTDTLAANRANITSIIVRPLSLRNPLLLLRFIAETPFRVLA